jgi:hypothetical protein
MKMLSEHVAQIVITTQRSHDLGDRGFRKSPLRLQSDGEEISAHLDEQRRVQSIAM